MPKLFSRQCPFFGARLYFVPSTSVDQVLTLTIPLVVLHTRKP